jgi:hypothetical protein
LALGHVQVDRHMPWEEKLPREEVHLDLPPLTPAVVDDAVHPDRRCFRGAGRVDVGRWLGLLFAIAQFRVPDFVRNQERLVEGEPLVSWTMRGRSGSKEARPPSSSAAPERRSRPDPEVVCYANSELIRGPRIAPALDGLIV